VKQRYEVVTSVGSGNFSKVYRVVDLHLSSKEQKRKPLAMKVIKKEYSSDAKYEKQMLITLHKNDTNHTARVSKMYECFVFQECPVFIMPIHGPSIRNRRLGINRGVVTREKLLEFAFDILETMDFVHFQCHMVHTDLKPENILIADSNVAENSMGDAWVVCDFGSASLWRMDKLDSDLISTRPYRAPEVVLGNKWHYAADMWSVGCILYEVAVGHRLFEIRDDITHLHMMERRVGKLPEAFTKMSKYSSKFFNARGEFLSTPDVIRFGKCRLTPIKDMFRDDKDFLHLLEGLLIYDPSRRMTATEALALPMFDSTRVARAKRLEQEAEEMEARRQRRRAAAAAAAAADSSSHKTPSDSLLSVSNGVAGTINSHLTDRTDHNAAAGAEEGKKPPQQPTSIGAAVPMTSGETNSTATIITPLASGNTRVSKTPRSTAATSMCDVTAAGRKSEAQAPRPHPPTDAADVGNEVHNPNTPGTDRSATETSTSRHSLNVSPGKETLHHKSRSSTGSALPLSASTSTVGGGGAVVHTKTGKTRSRAVSTPVATTKISSGSNAAFSSSTMSMSAVATGVVTKDTPSHRPVVENHRASTGSLQLPSSSGSTIVPKLALNRLTGSDAYGTTATSAAGTGASSITTTTKAPRTAGSGSKHTSGKSTLRTSSPATELLSSATAISSSTPTSKAKSLSSHTPRKASRTSQRDSGVNAEEAATTAAAESKTEATGAPSFAVPHVPDSTATARNIRSVTPVISNEVAVRAPAPLPSVSTAASTLSERAARKEQTPPPTLAVAPVVKSEATLAGSEVKPVSPAALPLGSGVVSTTTIDSSVPVVTVTPNAPATTSTRAISATPLGHQSPLKRGATAVGITTRVEPPVGIHSPNQQDENGGDRDHENNDRDGGEEEDFAPQDDVVSSSAVGDEEDDTEADSNNLPSPGATNPDGSPRATDYRSPVRRRPPVVTPTDDTSAQTSPELPRRFTVCTTSASSGEWTSMESAAAAAAGAASAATRNMKVHSHPFPQTQPAPNLALNSPRSEGHRTPREVSPAPITGRTNSPVTTARRSQQQATGAETTTATTTAAATANRTAIHDNDAYELASTVPIVRAPLSRGNSNSGSLTSTAVTSPNADALTRTVGPSASAANAAKATSSLAHESGAGQAAGTGGGYLFVVRSPHRSSVTPRASSSAAGRPSINSANAAAAAAGTTAAAPSTSATSTAAGHIGLSPSMKPVINVSASKDRLKSVPPSYIADIRGPSAIPVSASRRTVVKPGPATPSLNNNNSSSGIPEHPAAHFLTQLPSAPHGTTGGLHLPEAVTRSRERSMTVDTTSDRDKGTTITTTTTSRRGSMNSPNLASNAAADVTTPRTSLPSTAPGAGGATGTASLSSSLSLPSTSSHPTLGVVRQRSGSAHLVPSHPAGTVAATAAGGSGLESNPALTVSQLGVYTPRGSRVLQEHQAGVSGRGSATLPAVLPGSNMSGGNLFHSGGAGALNSPPPPSRGSRTSFLLATPGVTSDGEQISSPYAEHGAALTAATDSRPATPRESGRASVKSFDLQQLHTSANAGGGPRPPRSSVSRSAATSSPLKSAGGSGAKLPHYSSKVGGVSSASHSGQAALNASTGSLRLGVTRSPRMPVTPGAAVNSSNTGTTSLMASVDVTSTVSVRSPRSSSRATNSPRDSTSRRDLSKTVSPRRASSSPRTKANSSGRSSSAAEPSTTAPSAAAVAAATAADVSAPLSLTVPMQPLQQTAPMPGATRLSQPRRTITVISSKPSTSAQLSRYTNAAAVAPTRTSAARPSPPTDLVASTGRLSSTNGMNSSYKQPAVAASVSASMSTVASTGTMPSQQSSTVDSANVSASLETGTVSGTAAPKYRRDARTLKRIVVTRPSPQSSGASIVSPQDLGDDDMSSTSPSASMS
jgi:hypothetical protein